MSKERQRARAARKAAGAEERAAAARLAARRTKASTRASAKASAKASSKASGRASAARRPAKEPVYRLRRFPRLPWRLKAALALGWLAAALAILFLVPSWSGRLGLLVVTSAAVPLVIVLVRDPSRRPR